jgi:hypothetical protein
MPNSSERVQILLDQVASGQLSRRRFLTAVSTFGLTAGLSGAAVEHALAAGENQADNRRSSRALTITSSSVAAPPVRLSPANYQRRVPMS